ncbi:hypothetical protein [Cryptosporangium phraense]|uniref:Tetratricopeptide repeat protein n=1 Tax=Cryptosporangium phraense TaxID=2593070 RepID=A0A545AIE1_9ACTN|nr:hypothetical protein [Cryptosporangium phraense]TQS41094.1 hypothetical protein FL583_31530 [Cryptosporangium phraense]
MTSARANIEALVAQARSALRDERRSDAAFLFEQARRAALDSNDHRRAFQLGVSATKHWRMAAEWDRSLTMLLEILAADPAETDPQDLFEAYKQQFIFYIEVSPPGMRQIRESFARFRDSYSALRPGGPDFVYEEGKLLAAQGRFADAYDRLQIAYSRADKSDSLSIGPAWIASDCAQIAVWLDLRDEALLWIERIDEPYWDATARRHRAGRRLAVALRDRNIDDARTFLAAFDKESRGAQVRTDDSAVIRYAVASLGMDPSLGDPANPGHPANHRLNDLPERRRDRIEDRHRWAHTIVSIRLAALRYAAGMPTDEDYFCRPPHIDPAAFPARLPDEIRSRVQAARKACDDALVPAAELDTAFECEFRQRRIANLRARVEDIAQVHRIAA